ncbi:Rho termination factor N-terminal domain-containing protein [Klebsiella michiganensis]|uniref:Rho termination factor N-terminal domain-containing protein n=1 Tax=Klebsiella michiganensis TaxID=1134687 RepID=UPI0012B8D6E0|nr:MULTISPECIES: Rho termination factor N-terminal domain-containing protein [Enterobacteriaceae]
MRVLIRSSASGKEYWDTEEKRNVFVPKGQEPKFDTSEQTDMTVVAKAIVGDGVLFKSGEEIHLSGEELDSDGNTAADFDGEKLTDDQSDGTTDELEDMTAKELRAYAKKHGIDIPGAVRAKGDIIHLIREAE